MQGRKHLLHWSLSVHLLFHSLLLYTYSSHSLSLSLPFSLFIIFPLFTKARQILIFQSLLCKEENTTSIGVSVHLPFTRCWSTLIPLTPSLSFISRAKHDRFTTLDRQVTLTELRCFLVAQLIKQFHEIIRVNLWRSSVTRKSIYQARTGRVLIQCIPRV